MRSSTAKSLAASLKTSSGPFFPAERPAVTVDCVVFGYDGRRLQLLLIKRRDEPFAGLWALPGGFIRGDESLDAAALRELKEETGIAEVYLEQLYTFGEPGRDPRGRVVSVAYFALVKPSQHLLEASTDAVDAAWFPVDELPVLGFDHSLIVKVAIKRLQAKVRYAPIGFELLPREFALPELQAVYEAILGQPLDKRNFRKKILSMGILSPLAKQRKGAGRSAQLFEFDPSAYERYTRSGFSFEV